MAFLLEYEVIPRRWKTRYLYYLDNRRI